MNDLSDGVQEEKARDERAVCAGADDHCDRVNDRDGVKEGLDDDVPDGGDVAIFDVDGAEEKSDAERKGVELEDGERDEEPRPSGGDAV